MSARRVPLVWLMVVSQGAALLVLLIAAAARGTASPPLHVLLPAAAGGLAGAIGLSAFYRALAVGTMSIVAPIAAAGVLVPVTVGIAGGDRPGALQLAGMAATIAGVVLASREGAGGDEGETGGTASPSHHARSAAALSVPLALVAAIGFGSFAVGLRSSARHDVLWALVAARAAGWLPIAVAFLILAARRPVPAGLGRRLAALAGIGSLDLAANALYALATRHGLLSVVAVGSSLYPVITVLLARVVLHERVDRTQELGVAAVLAGVVAIAAAG